MNERSENLRAATLQFQKALLTSTKKEGHPRATLDVTYGIDDEDDGGEGELKLKMSDLLQALRSSRSLSVPGTEEPKVAEEWKDKYRDEEEEVDEEREEEHEMSQSTKLQPQPQPQHSTSFYVHQDADLEQPRSGWPLSTTPQCRATFYLGDSPPPTPTHTPTTTHTPTHPTPGSGMLRASMLELQPPLQPPLSDAEKDDLLEALVAENERLKDKINAVLGQAQASLKDAAAMNADISADFARRLAEQERHNASLYVENEKLRDVVDSLRGELGRERAEVARTLVFIDRLKRARGRHPTL